MLARCRGVLVCWCPGVVCVLVSGVVPKACLLDGGLSLYQHICIYMYNTRKGRRTGHRPLGARGVPTASDPTLRMSYDLIMNFGTVMFMDFFCVIVARQANVCATYR